MSKFEYVVTLLFTNTINNESYEKPLRIHTNKDYIDVVELTDGIDSTIEDMGNHFKYEGLKEKDLSEITLSRKNGFKS